MTSFRPTAEQERWRMAANRLGVARDTPWLATRLGDWKAADVLIRCAFFVLGVITLGLIAGILDLLHVTHFLFVAGVMAIGTAEWLILRKRLFNCGIEEALESVGAVMIALQTNPEGAFADAYIPLLIALMLLGSGARLLNPMLITLSAMAFSLAIEVAARQTAGRDLNSAMLAGGFCMCLAWAALYISGRQLRRPSVDQMLNWLMVTMPIAAYLWLAIIGVSELPVAASLPVFLIRCLPALVLALFGLPALITGIRRRSHAPIIASLISLGCFAYEIRRLTSLPFEAKLIGGGTVTLWLTVGLDRYLRIPRRGITSNNLVQGNGSLDLLQVVGAGDLVPPSTRPVDATLKGGGGAFSGGGASTDY